MDSFRCLALLILVAILPGLELQAQQAEGYWNFVKMEVQNDRQDVATFEGEEGNVKITYSVTLNLDTGEKQTISARYSWDAPPRVLIAGQKVKIPLKATVLMNTHPNGAARFIHGGGTVYFGSVPGPDGSGSFKDKSGNYTARFASYGDPAGGAIIIQKGEIVLQGEREIPAGNSANPEDLQNTVPIVVSLNLGNDSREYAYFYRWNQGVPPKGTEPGSAESNVAGVWQHGSNGETWTLTPRGDGSYSAVEKGFDNASGTATAKDNRIHIDYTNSKGVSGEYEIVISPDGKTGRGTWNDDSPDSGTRDFVKVGGPTAEPSGGPGAESPKQFTVRAGSRRVNAGENLLLPIELIESQGLGNINVTIEYKTSVVQATGKPTAGTVKGNRSFEANHTQAGAVYLGLAGSKGLESDGQLALIPFRAVGQPGDITDVKVSVTTSNHADGRKMDAIAIPGKIEIVQAGGDGSGDADGSGKVDPGDALDALKMSVKLIPENMAADMDGDSTVTSNDARLILLKVVGK